MPTFRIEKNKGYTVMSNYHLKDSSLSLKAKGLLSQMLSLPENWNYTLKGLTFINKESLDAIRTAVWELEKAGYVKREQGRDEKGKMTNIEYIIYEQPQNVPILDNPTTAEPLSACPLSGFPTTDTPTSENPTQLNIDISNTDKSSKDKSTTDLSITNQSINQRGSADINTSTDEVIGGRSEVGYVGEGSYGEGNKITFAGKTVSEDKKSMISPIDNTPYGESVTKPIATKTVEIYRNLIRENVEYEFLIQRYEEERVNEVIEIMLEVLCSKRRYFKVGEEEYPAELVKSKMLKINSAHLEYVFGSIDKSSCKIRNIKNYLLTSLYNSTMTMNNYYCAEVGYDMRGILDE